MKAKTTISNRTSEDLNGDKGLLRLGKERRRLVEIRKPLKVKRERLWDVATAEWLTLGVSIDENVDRWKDHMASFGYVQAEDEDNEILDQINAIEEIIRSTPATTFSELAVKLAVVRDTLNVEDEQPRNDQDWDAFLFNELADELSRLSALESKASIQSARCGDSISGNAGDAHVVANLAVLAKVHTEAKSDADAGLLNIIQEHEAAFLAWDATGTEDGLSEGSPEDRAAYEAETRLIFAPCRSYADVLAKIGYIYHRETAAAQDAYDMVVGRDDDFLGFLGSLIGIEAPEICTAADEAGNDTLTDVIHAYRAGVKAYADHPEFSSLDEENEVAEAAYGVHADKLDKWHASANSREEAMEALRFALEDAAQWGGSATTSTMIKAALGYLEGGERAAGRGASTKEAVAEVSFFSASASPKLLGPVERHKAANAAFENNLHMDEQSDPRYDPAAFQILTDAEDEAALDVVGFVALSQIDLQLKGHHLLNRDYGHDNEEMLAALLSSMTGLAYPSVTADAFVASPHPDADLIAWGGELERLRAAFNDAEAAAVAVEDQWRASGLARGSDAYWAFVTPSNTKMNEASDAVDAVAKLIRNREAATPAGLVVKAKALRWDASLYGADELPIEDWDWDKECVHLFIAELQRFADAHPRV